MYKCFIGLVVVALLGFASCKDGGSRKGSAEKDFKSEKEKQVCKDYAVRVMGSGVDADKFCDCFMGKLTGIMHDSGVDISKILSGRIENISMQEAQQYTAMYKGCLSDAISDPNARVKMTPEMKAGMVRLLKSQLGGTNVGKICDIEKFCNCYMEQVESELTIRETFQLDNADTAKINRIRAHCLKESLIVPIK